MTNFPDFTDEDTRLGVKIAKLYYESELTQQQIAKKLGLSRIKVHRILSRARDTGIVEIKFHTPENETFIEQEHELTLKFDLRDALVVPASESVEKLYVSLARVQQVGLSQRWNLVSGLV